MLFYGCREDIPTERKRKGGQRTKERAGRRATTAGAGLRKSQHRAMREGIDRTRRDNRRDEMSAGASLKYDFKGGKHVKDFFKCTAIVLAVIVFGLALSAIVH